MSVVNFKSKWFRCYSKAKLESDPNALGRYVKDALDATNEALIQPGLEDGERKAIVVAIQDLHLMEGETLLTFRNQPPRQNRTPEAQ